MLHHQLVQGFHESKSSDDGTNWREKRMHVREGKNFSVIDPSCLLIGNGDVNNRGSLANSNISNVSGVSDASSGSFEARPRPILPVSRSVGNLNNSRRRVGVRPNKDPHPHWRAHHY